MIPLSKITKIAKESFLKIGTALATAFVDTCGGEIIMVGLVFDSDANKLKAIDSLRDVVGQSGSEHYVVVNEAWIKKLDIGNEYPVRAGRYVDRKECLILTEYKKGHNTVSYVHPIIRGKKITFGKEQVMDGVTSRWNVFLEKEGLNEHMDKDFESMRKQFFKKQSKKYADKYKERFFAEKTEAGKKKVLCEMIEDMTVFKKEHDKKIYEDSTS